MPGFLVQQGTVVTCPHGGSVTLIGNPKVVAVTGGVVTASIPPLVIAGCSLMPKPCTLLSVLVPSTRVKLLGGLPLYTFSPVPTTVSDGTTPGPGQAIGVQIKVQVT